MKNVLAKLQNARMALIATSIKKGGRNEFAKYNYMELADFLIPAQGIFSELGLVGVVSFGHELASLTITDLDSGEQVVITSPMSTAALKGCHEVQNLGAVQTYLRRYLWVAALEIVEHDAIDSAKPRDESEEDAKLLQQYQEAALNGMAALKAFHTIAKGESRTRVWKAHGEALKAAANKAEEVAA